ncbi:MAG: DUF3267 domain-containing protein [Christensenellales bacterium]|jgi:hypothetical protein
MNTLQLPEGYQRIYAIDLQRDKKTAWLLNGLALIILVLMIGLGFILRRSFTVDITQMIVFFVAMVVYTVLHEVVHGVFIRLYSGEKPKFGFTGLYAYAGNDRAYFDKKSYIVIALSPVIILGAVLLLLQFLIPSYFWVIYFLQALNIAGASGDYLVVYLCGRMPRDLLINDTGVAMYFYSRQPLKRSGEYEA